MRAFRIGTLPSIRLTQHGTAFWYLWMLLLHLVVELDPALLSVQLKHLKLLYVPQTAGGNISQGFRTIVSSKPWIWATEFQIKAVFVSWSPIMAIPLCTSAPTLLQEEPRKSSLGAGIPLTQPLDKLYLHTGQLAWEHPCQCLMARILLAFV